MPTIVSGRRSQVVTIHEAYHAIGRYYPVRLSGSTATSMARKQLRKGTFQAVVMTDSYGGPGNGGVGGCAHGSVGAGAAGFVFVGVPFLPADPFTPLTGQIIHLRPRYHRILNHCDHRTLAILASSANRQYS